MGAVNTLAANIPINMQIASAIIGLVAALSAVDSSATSSDNRFNIIVNSAANNRISRAALDWI